VLFFSVCLSFDPCAQAAKADLSKRLGKVIKEHSIAKANIGLMVVPLGAATGKEAEKPFGLNEGQPMIPASVTKLATASAVLWRLGASMKFQTTLVSKGNVQGDVLRGDLVLKGAGDPGFVSETMWFLVNDFERGGIKKIDGDILVDDTEFDLIRNDPSREPDRVDRAYDSPVGAMSFNWNAINIFVRPAAKVGQPPQVILDPLRDYCTIVNKAKTVAGVVSKLEISRVKDQVFVSGSLGIKHEEVVVFKNIDDPVSWSGKNLQFFLSQRGISVTGKVKGGVCGSDCKVLAKADSKPVGDSVSDMLKFSNNYVAEMLTKSLASKVSNQRPATLATGMQVVRDHLAQDLSIPISRFKLINPSGLNRENRITARDLAEILVQSQQHFPTFAEFLTALPIAGFDGTLKRRMKDSATAGWVRAKTGNLNGVVSLAGYAGHKDGSLTAFAFIFNGKPNQGDSARQLFDALASQLVQ
jgi:D-alanyl-D-alanine carboxypeptidase/D-alanyl-D-alanine-endopeptidase (penicillin-binding protein 4)